jgi:ABC-2 type transport system permease protein
MTGTLALTKLEVIRMRRNKRYLLFTIGLPVVLYLSVGRQTSALAYGVSFQAYYMVAMASIGSFSGALTGNSQRIAQERKDGWIRQLRLTPLPASSYVIAKVFASMATTVPAIVIVLALGRYYGNVHLAGWKFLVIGLAVWLASLTFAALAVALGYRFTPDSVQPVAMLVYFVMSILGGLWFPLGGTLRDIAKALPTYQVTQFAADVISKGSFSITPIVIVLAWFAGFIVLAALAVRSTAEKV